MWIDDVNDVYHKTQRKHFILTSNMTDDLPHINNYILTPIK